MSSQRAQALLVEIDQLKAKLACCQAELRQLEPTTPAAGAANADVPSECGLTQDEIARYSRQLIMPEIGVRGQLRLRGASVLVVGTGGLGCAAALYLAGAGVGRLGLVDGDVVELNNLHRQLLHTESSVGRTKAESGRRALNERNRCIDVRTHSLQLDRTNALRVLAEYDVVVDATDNVPTRYLINDACVLLARPLVSGSALRLEGQLTVYNYRGGPCYRCVFPVPTPQSLVTNCGDAGVLGAVVGVIGTLQALEALKIVLRGEDEVGGGDETVLGGTLLMFDAARTQFRRIRLRGRNRNCAVCGDEPSIRELIDYEHFCAARASDKTHDVEILDAHRRMDVRQFEQLDRSGVLVVDVRTATEFEIGSIGGAVNVPIDVILDGKLQAIEDETVRERLLGDGEVVVICRRGNDSQRAVLKLLEMQPEKKHIRDLIGGLTEWHRLIDRTFPIY